MSEDTTSAAREAFDALARSLAGLTGRAVRAAGLALARPGEGAAGLAGPWVVLEDASGAPLAALPVADARALLGLLSGHAEPEDGEALSPTDLEALGEAVGQGLAAALGVAGAARARIAEAEFGWPLGGAEAVVGSLAADGPDGTEARLAVPAARVRAARAARAREGDQAGLGLVLDIVVPVRVELGRARLPIRDIVALHPGAVVELDRLAGEPVDVMVEDRRIARGEVVVVDERFGVRLTEIAPAADRVPRP